MDREVEMDSDNYSQGAAPGAAPQRCTSVMEEPQEGAATKEPVPSRVAGSWAGPSNR